MPQSLPPTKGQARIRALAYFFAFAAGTWVLITPPRTIEGTIGIASTITWGILLLPASVVMVAAWKAKWRVEYALLPALIAGVAIYSLAIWGSVPETITRGPQACMITSLAFALGARFKQLRDLRKAKGSTWNQDGSN